MTKALLEGVAFALRDSMKFKEMNIKSKTIRLSGGEQGIFFGERLYVMFSI